MSTTAPPKPYPAHTLKTQAARIALLEIALGAVDLTLIAVQQKPSQAAPRIKAARELINRALNL